MPTNLALSDELIAEAVKVGNHRTKRDAVTAALEEYIRMKKRLRLLEMEGKVDFWPGYNHKNGRRRGNKRLPRE
jgi:Arc/MetJ family transcription regulator